MGTQTMNDQETVRQVREWFEGTRQVAGPILPDGWFGRPFDNTWFIVDVYILDDVMTMQFVHDCIIFISKPRLVRADQAGLTLWGSGGHVVMSYGNPALPSRNYTFGNGEVTFLPC